MENKEDRYVNVTLKSDNNDKEKDVIISISSIFKGLKKYFLIWVVTAVVAAVLATTGAALASSDKYKTITALVSFTYNGIEKGLDPAGNKFDVNSLKNPTVIENALTELGYPLDELENIRQNISIEGIKPPDAIDRITTYKSVYENAQNGAISAAQAMLDVAYYPTQYKVHFNYSDTSFDSAEAVEVFNTLLNGYRNYFFEIYGYNEALGSAVTALDYTDYDYAEAIDVFDATLTSLKNYVNTLSKKDTTRFRSIETGYTFADLSETIKTFQDIDLDIVSSYIIVNNVTRDKDALITYYQYRIDSLTRSKTIAEEELASITNSIKEYVKDDILIFGNGTDSTNTQSTQSSEQYDNLFEKRIDAQQEVSTTTQQINFYNQRMEALKSKPAGSDTKIEKVEEDLKKINEKINTLIDSVNRTADDYYENVSFVNAYNVLVPASASPVSFVKKMISTAMKPVLVVEALLFVVYLCMALFMSISAENKNFKKIAVVDNDEEPENDKPNEKTPNKKSNK